MGLGPIPNGGTKKIPYLCSMQKEIKLPRYRFMEFMTLAEICCHVQYRVPMPPEVITIEVPDNEFPEGTVVQVGSPESGQQIIM